MDLQEKVARLREIKQKAAKLQIEADMLLLEINIETRMFGGGVQVDPVEHAIFQVGGDVDDDIVELARKQPTTTTKDAAEKLDLNVSTVKRLLADPKSCLTGSKRNGRWEVDTVSLIKYGQSQEETERNLDPDG